MRLFSVIFALCLAAVPVMGPAFAQDASQPQTVRFAFLKPINAYGVHNYQPGETDVRRTLLDYLERSLPDIKFEPYEFTITDLARGVIDSKIDYALISSGQYIELQSSMAAYALCSLFTARFPDPNRFTGALFVTTADHDEINGVADMRGRRGAFNNRVNFINYQLPLAEIAAAGFDPEGFFSREIFTDDHPDEVLRLLLAGEADVGFFRVCEYETLMETRPELRGRFKPIGLKSDGNHACLRSTELYPGWTVAMTSRIDPAVTKLVTQTLLAMPPDPVSGMGWSIATEFGRVQDLFRTIRMGPYEYLRDWTIERLWREYWPFIALVAVLAAAWVMHSLSVQRQAQSMARELSDAYHRQREIEDKAVRTEERLSAVSKLGVVSQLSSIFAHEMGQPLAAIRYRARAVETMMKRPGDMREAILESLRVIQAQSSRAADILQKVRSYAKGHTTRDAAIRLDLLVENTVGDLRRSGRLGCPVSIRTDSVTVRGDELEVGIAVLNIMKNAAEAAGTSPGASVSLRLSAASGKAVLVVENTGSEITREMITKFMTPMGSLKEKGIGLGIVIISSIAEAHEGYYTLEPRKGGGAVARLVLPLPAEAMEK